MSTTLIFAEFLSIGALTLLSIGLLAVAVGLDPGLLLALIGNGPAVGITLGLSLAYPLGITVDGCADRLFRSVGHKTEKTNVVPVHVTIFSLACDKTRWCDFAGKYFEYNRIKTRLARSFTLNSILMAVTGAAAGMRTHTGADLIVAWVALWVLLAAAALWTLHELRETSHRKLAEAWKAGQKFGADDAQISLRAATPGPADRAEASHLNGDAVTGSLKSVDRPAAGKAMGIPFRGAE